MLLYGTPTKQLAHNRLSAIEYVDTALKERIRSPYFYFLKFGISVCTDEAQERKINPKRLQREIKKEVTSREVGTKAQMALQLQFEA